MARPGLRGGPMAARGAIAAFVVALLLAGPGHASASSHPDREDAELRSRIEAKLAALPDREGADVRVAVSDGQVVLRGRVRLLEQSLRTEQAVWKTSGVLDVDNELRVVYAGAGGDAEIEQRVRMVIKGDGRFLDTNLELEVVAGRVRMRGLFQDPSDVLALKHRIASVPGVLNVEIDALLVALGAASQPAS